jgi:hypothetical protein
VKEEHDVPEIQVTVAVPSNVIDITTRKRKNLPARPNALGEHRPYLQLVKFSPTELPAA